MQQGDKFAEFYLDKTNVYETILNVYYHEVGSEKIGPPVFDKRAGTGTCGEEGVR